ncbi:unnamed protein product [Caenorhabditis brenneri]
MICLIRAINNIFVLVFDFLLLTFPVMLFSQNFYPIAIESIIIATTINVYMVNSYHCLLIVINRFVAMYAPLYYSKLCGIKVTLVILFVFYLERFYAIAAKLYTVFDKHCKMYLSLETFGPTYENSTCSKELKDDFGGIVIVLIPLGIFAFTVIMNLATFAKILHFYLGSSQIDAENTVSVKKNIRLFFQTVLQDSCFFVDIIFTFQLSHLSDHRIWYFISTVLVWESIHMLDGFIMLMFSDRLSILKSLVIRQKSNRLFVLTSRFEYVLPEKTEMDWLNLIGSFVVLIVSQILSQNFYPLDIETLIIVSTINVYMVNSYHCLLIVINRFVAMYAPLYYSTICGIKITLAILVAFYLERFFAIGTRLYNVFEKHCRMYLSLESFGPDYENSACPKELKNDFDGVLIVLVPLSIFAFTVILNLTTAHKWTPKVSVRKNIRLFVQTVFQDSCYFIDIMFTFRLSHLSDHRIWYFISTVFVWESIHMLDGSSNIYPDIIETVIITSTINVYLVNQLQTVAIALNRFIALYLPFRYKTLCSNQVAWVVLGLLYAQRGYETFSKLYDLISNDCKIHMDSDTFYTSYYDRNCSKKVPVDSDLIVLMPSIFLAITIILNLATFAKIVRFYFFNSMNSESTSLAMKNIRLFFQTVFQDALFLIDATFTFKLSALSDSRIWIFISTVFVWESIHTLDGLIMLLFSDRLAILRARFTRISSNQVSSTSGVGGTNRRGGRASSSLPGVA